MKKINEKDLELVDSYIMKEMSDAEIQVFEERLKSDIDVKNLLLATMAINSAIRKEKLKKQINYLAEQHIIYKRKKKIAYTFSLSSILLLAIFISMYFIYQNKESGIKLYAEYYQAYEPQLLVRGVESNDKLKTAIGFYEAKQYDQSINVLQEIISLQNGSDELSFYMGLNLLELGVKQADAVSHLEKVSNGRSSYKYSAMWFLSMLYLKSNQADEAKALLDSLSKTKNYYSKNAKELLEKL